MAMRIIYKKILIIFYGIIIPQKNYKQLTNQNVNIILMQSGEPP